MFKVIRFILKKKNKTLKLSGLVEKSEHSENIDKERGLHPEDSQREE